MSESWDALQAKDNQIEKVWCASAQERGDLRLFTSGGVELTVRSMVHPTARKVEYNAYLPDGRKVAWVYPSIIRNGCAEITNVRVFGRSYERKGIATAMYDLVENDIKQSGGKGLRPDVENMSPDALRLWAHRRPEDVVLQEKIQAELERLKETGELDSWEFAKKMTPSEPAFE